jgi:phage terminase small subunit
LEIGIVGKRGPKPRTAETLRLHGSNEQYNRQGEVAVIEGEPTKPSGLGEHGAAMWDRMVERLRNQGIISPAWQETLTVLCRLWDEVNAAMVDGSERRELLAVVAAFWKCAADFGLTPAAKTGIRTEPKPAGKDKSRFVKGTA